MFGLSTLKRSSLALFAGPALMALAPSASAAELGAPAFSQAAPATAVAKHHRGKHDRYDRYDRGRGYGNQGRYAYGEPVYRDTRVWRARDGRYHCRKRDGTTGLLVGAAVGGLIGNEVAGRGDRTLGTVLGAVGGALLGRAIDRSNARCR